ncbi:MAG: RhuM family protein [Treponema sp.]|nr:RhuM family protein [Treponema sp.]
MTQSECVAMENEILLYTDETGKMNVNIRFAEEDVWVTQVQLAEIYATTRQNIGQHIENIYKDNELPREATIKKFFIVQTEGNRQVKREIDHYNLDVIIAIGYRVQSETATRFRRWATQRLISSKRTCKS